MDASVFNQILKITVIGSGNAFNMDGRANAAYLVETSSGKNFLIDAGPTTLYRLRQMKFETSRIDFILITHFHGDHIAGLPFILLDMDIIQKRRDELVIAGPAGISFAWKQWYDLGYGEHALAFPVNAVELMASGSAVLGGIRVETGKITHRPESIGFRLTDSRGRIFSYTGDAALDQNAIDLVNGSDAAVLELTMDKNENSRVAHISLEELLLRRKEIQAGRIILSHTADAVIGGKELPGEAAYDGMEIIL